MDTPDNTPPDQPPFMPPKKMTVAVCARLYGHELEKLYGIARENRTTASRIVRAIVRSYLKSKEMSNKK